MISWCSIPTRPHSTAASGDALIDSLIFASAPPVVRDVMVGGKWVVREGRHRAEKPIGAAFRRAIDRIAIALGP